MHNLKSPHVFLFYCAPTEESGLELYHGRVVEKSATWSVFVEHPTICYYAWKKFGLNNERRCKVCVDCTPFQFLLLSLGLYKIVSTHFELVPMAVGRKNPIVH
jgi:hypothetical protein